MLQTIEAVNTVINNFIWGIPTIICIIGWGLYGHFRYLQRPDGDSEPDRCVPVIGNGVSIGERIFYGRKRKRRSQR